MCGIAGIFGYETTPDRDVIIEMVERLRHRGPIEDGFHLKGRIALGMRRLSIIDIAGGHQPIYNEDRSVAVIFNGEIYNYVELQQELASHGHTFTTHSDTETIVHLYEEMGIGCLDRLNGMFAIAIWDERKKELFICRDRLGVKPLYYSDGSDYLVFASEIKSLLVCPFIDRSLDRDAFTEYLTLMYIRAPRTPFKAIRKLPPGHYARIDANGVHVHQWWDLNDFSMERSITFEEASREILNLLDESVRLRLRSDVPVGSFLSGGIDSSAITALAAHHLPNPVNTYSVGFDGLGFNELGYASSVAKAFHTNHNETTVTAKDALNHLPQLAWHLDEPLADSAIVPTFLVSKFAAGHLRVMLSGLGGDELFGGYSRYFDGYAVEHLYRQIPSIVREGVMTPVAETVAPRVGSLLRLNNGTLSSRYLARVSTFPPVLAQGLVGGRSSVDMEAEFARYSGSDSVNHLMFVDALTYLPDDILHITDRMSMAVSLEVRTPFLDYRLVQLAAGIPGAFKVGPLKREWKRCLKNAFREILPKEILERPKWGFGAPVVGWMEQGVQEVATNLLNNSAAVDSGILDGKFLRSYLQQPPRGEGRASRAQRLWSLLILELWMRVFVGSTGEAPSFSLYDLCEV